MLKNNRYKGDPSYYNMKQLLNNQINNTNNTNVTYGHIEIILWMFYFHIFNPINNLMYANVKCIFASQIIQLNNIHQN